MKRNIQDQSSIRWLLQGDVSIQYQVYRGLLNSNKSSLRKRIAQEGWGKKFLSYRLKSGHWGLGFYQLKWTCSHYTLLDLKNLNIAPDVPEIRETIKLIFDNEKGKDGGLNPTTGTKNSDVCINGMALNYSSYFRVNKIALKSVVDFLLTQHMRDGGYNCQSNRSGAVHSSLHTTLSVLEGILEYKRNGYTYRLSELEKTAEEAEAFILQHKLFKSDKTGKIIDEKMLLFSWPCRWRYDIFRALDYFQDTGVGYDKRMDDAIEILLKKRTKDKKWLLQGKHPGQTHFNMEKEGEPSRWNTLRAMRILKHFGIDN
jgi:hypothetical protein